MIPFEALKNHVSCLRGIGHLMVVVKGEDRGNRELDICLMQQININFIGVIHVCCSKCGKFACFNLIIKQSNSFV